MTVTVAAPRAEYNAEALGIGRPDPRLSWITSAPPAWTPAGYEIEVSGRSGTSSSGRIDSADSVFVPWPVAPLRSRERVDVRVRVWGAGDPGPSAWSPAAPVEAGLLDPSDWEAVAIQSFPVLVPMNLRRGFDVAGDVASARLYVTAHGVYELELNGVTVGGEVLAPGWTPYGERLLVSTFDVTGMLRAGRNAIGARLGDGWYRGRFGGHGGHMALYGRTIALLAQLEIELTDGTRVVVPTDEQWRSGPSGLLSSNLLDGEHVDARFEPVGWSLPGFDDSGWNRIDLADLDREALEHPIGPPIRRTEEVRPVAILPSPSGATIVDFGQNLAGRVRFTVRGPRGRSIWLRHAEILDAGELYTRNLRVVAATDRYVLSGDGVETWEPRFTVHGFRYVEVTGWPGELTVDDLVAVVVHTDMERTGTFSCSDSDITRLHENIVWTLRSNFVGLPTDCPQRDERWGWTADAQLFTETASFLYDVDGALSSWLRDLEIEQGEDGVVPVIVPNPPAMLPSPAFSITPVAVWSDAAVLVPWKLYQRFGDVGVLERQYASARAWTEAAIRITAAERRWPADGLQIGDHLAPSAPSDDPSAGATHTHLVADAYLAHVVRRMSDIARLLGRDDDRARYAAEADVLRDAFVDHHIGADGVMSSDSQTAYALALAFDLGTGVEQRDRLRDRLVAIVERDGYQVGTGLAGTPLILDALCDAGAEDAAARMLARRGFPSWLYPLSQGATTIWERWDGIRPDGSILDADWMNSFNHYALGAVGDWLHRTLAGIAPAAPGYREILFRPRARGEVTWAEASLRTPYGRAGIRWELQDGSLVADVTVPTGATGIVDLPGLAPVPVGPGAHRVIAPLAW